MLLRNESIVKHSIQVKLVFDDNIIRELDINVGDFVHTSYRKNGCVRCGMGVIRKIEPYIKKYYDSCCCKNPVESAVIILDMSTENNAYVEKINLEDIIDIDFVYPCCCTIPDVGINDIPEVPVSCCCCNSQCKCNKEEEIAKPVCNCSNAQCTCSVEEVVTNNEVVTND